MTKTIKSILIFLILLSYVVFAQDLILSTDQSEYYFLINQPAQLIINVSNPYGEVSGLMSHTSTQKIQTANTVMQTSNSNSQSFSMPAGNSSFGINLGSSQAVGELDLSLSFDYSVNVTQMKTTLNNIKIYFIEDKEQQQNEKDQKQSQTKTQEELKEEYEQQLKEQQKRQQQEMEEKLRQQQEAKKLDNRMQNNQQFQDTNNLKNQMQQEMQKQQQLQQEFKQALEQNQEFQKKMNDLFNQGYNQTNAQLDPTNSTSGDFKVEFNKDGNNLTLSGNMQNNNITEMHETKSINRDQINQMIKNHPKYQQYDQQLGSQAFTQQDWIYEFNENETIVTIPYTNGKNESKKIQAIVANESVIKIELVDGNNYFFLIILVIIIILLAMGYLLYIKSRKKEIEQIQHKEKRFNFKKEALLLLENSKKLFDKKQYKDAYSMASQAIRLYYSYKIGLKKEITNTEIIKELKRNSINHKNTQECLNLCSLVEFAKYQANQKDFIKIIKLAKQIIG